MIKEGKRYDVYVCDGCNQEMREPEYQRNDGSYQDNFITVHGMHLCNQCGARVLKGLIHDGRYNLDISSYKSAFIKDTKRAGFNHLFDTGFQDQFKPRVFSQEDFNREYGCNFTPDLDIKPERTIYYLKYNKEQDDEVMDGQMYNQPYGITPDSWKEIKAFAKEHSWSESDYTFTMDNKNYQFIFKLKNK